MTDTEECRECGALVGRFESNRHRRWHIDLERQHRDLRRALADLERRLT